MKNVAHKIIGDWFVAVWGENPPTEEEGRLILSVFKTLDFSRMRMLVFTRGGAPTPAQRKAMNEALQGTSFTTAIVTDVTLVRGVVTALSWFNSSIKAFSTAQVEDAFRYLQIPTTQYDLFRREVRRLEAELSTPVRKR